MSTGRTDRIADAVRLLAAVGAVAADPTLLSALRSAPSAYDALKKIAAAPPSSVGRLAETLAGAARTTFAATRDLPPDADLLYIQMVEIGIVGAPEIVAAGMDAGAVAEAMLGKLTDPEHRSGPMTALFRALTVPVLDRLLADKAFAADLTPAFMREMLGARQEIADVSAKLDDIAGQSRDTLEALALRFGEPEPEAMPLAALKGFLVEKAKDYRRLEAQVRALGDREGRIANLKAAAEDAIRELRLDEAKALIRDAIAVQRSERTLQALRDDAALVETEAEIALLENDADEAYRLLSGAAEAFVPFDAEEAFRRRRDFLQRLHRHGERFGGSGLARAIEMGLRNLSAVDEEKEPYAWAMAQNDLGVALGAHGVSIGGQAGAKLFSDAAAAFRGALRVRNEAAYPSDWAMTQTNLATALLEQSELAGDEAGARLFGEAVEAYRSAMRVWSEAAQPVEWAGIHNNLGNALQARGRRVGGAEGARLIREAVAAYRAALRVYTEAEHPVDWAMTQSNLGVALWWQGERVDVEAGPALLGKAVAAHRVALRVRTEVAYPVDWAGTQNNLGIALTAQGARVGGKRGAWLLGKAVDACRAALRVRTEAAHPIDWAGTQTTLGEALRVLGTLVGGMEGAKLIGEAVAAHQAALGVLADAMHPIRLAAAMENLGLAYEALAETNRGREREVALAEATQCLKSAVGGFDPEHMPYNRAKADASLARVLATLDRDSA